MTDRNSAELDRLCRERREKIREISEVAGVSPDEAEDLVDNWNEAIVGETVRL
jgi:hypothetical protein